MQQELLDKHDPPVTAHFPKNYLASLLFHILVVSALLQYPAKPMQQDGNARVIRIVSVDGPLHAQAPLVLRLCPIKVSFLLQYHSQPMPRSGNVRVVFVFAVDAPIHAQARTTL